MAGVPHIEKIFGKKNLTYSISLLHCTEKLSLRPHFPVMVIVC